MNSAALEPRVLAVHLRQGPAGRALVDVELGDFGLDRRHDLDRAAAGADHGDALAGEVDVVAPLGGVEGRALKVLQPRDRRHLRHRELAAGGDQDVGLVRAGAGLEQPAAALLVPAGALHLGAGADPVEDAEAAGDALDVGADLGPGRVAARPAVGREGELVEVGGDVAGGAGVGVVLPDAADPLALLEDGDVLVALAPQHRGGADAAEAAADDRDRGPAATQRRTPPARSRRRARRALAPPP